MHEDSNTTTASPVLLLTPVYDVASDVGQFAMYSLLQPRLRNTHNINVIRSQDRF